MSVPPVIATDAVAAVSRPTIGWRPIVGVVLLTLLVGSVGWRDESYSEIGGDQPKYLVNAAFFLDAFTDAPAAVRNFSDYARNYYARYPALSLGHHPFLPSLLAAPMYALFGVSVHSARIVPLASFALASVLLLLLVERAYDRWVAIAATLIFVLSPTAAWFSRILSSEMPAVAALMAAVFFSERYGRNRRNVDLWLFMLAAVTSLWAKQITFVMLPVFAIQLIRHHGLGIILRREVIACALFSALLLAPLVVLTSRFSANDVSFFMASATGEGVSIPYGTVITQAMAAQLSWPVVWLAFAGIARSAWTRDGRSVLFIIWTLAFVALVIVLTKDVETDRFTVFWTPALATLAATLVSGWKAPTLRAAAVGIMVLALANETVDSSGVHLGGADGYEEGARYVLDHTQGPTTVLFDGSVDTGYFVFFVRKHDPDRRMIVLRSDKVIHDLAEVEPSLRAFGTRFVAIEAHRGAPPAADSLESRLRLPPFVERLRIPLQSTDARLERTDLVLFENVGVPAPDPEARLVLNVPLGGLLIDVRLGNLIDESNARSRSFQPASE